MKPMPIALLLLLLACFACDKTTVPPPEEDMLYRVECFYQTHLDSARQILDTLDLSVLSEKERAHYCLLSAKVNDGLRKYNDFDSLMQVAEKQFIGGKDKYFEAMTFWILARKAQIGGMGNQYVLDYRLKALQSIEQCKHVDERFVRFSLKPTDEQNEIDRLKYAIHQRVGMSYTNSGYYREGVDHLKRADHYYVEKQYHRNRMITAYPLGMAYLLLGEYDSCLMYYNIGLHSAETIHDTIEATYYHTLLSSYYLYCFEMQHFEDEEDGKNLLRLAIDESRRGLDNLMSVKGMNTYDYQFELNDNIARAYFDLQQYDSCVYYDLIAEGMTLRKENLTFIYKRLYGSYKALGDETNAAVYADKLLSIGTDYGAEQKALAEVKDDYDHHLEMQRVESEQQLRRYRLYLWIGVLVVLLLAVLWLAFRYRKNKELETMRLREESLRLQSTNERMSHEVSNALLRRVNYIYRSHEDDAYNHILAEFKSVYPQAIPKLKADHPDLNDAEIGVCLLSFLSFRVKEIGIILGFKENTISKYRAFIRSKTGIEAIEDVLKNYVESKKE